MALKSISSCAVFRMRRGGFGMKFRASSEAPVLYLAVTSKPKYNKVYESVRTLAILSSSKNEL